MYLIIAIVVVLILLYYFYGKERFEPTYYKEEDVIPKLDKKPSECVYQCEVESDGEEITDLDEYNKNFYNFQNRIFQSSHQDDVVDNVVRTHNASDYKVGMSIKSVYDDLTNARR